MTERRMGDPTRDARASQRRRRTGEIVESDNGRANSVDVGFAIWLSRQLRRQRVSQREVARRSGLSHSTISRILLGEREPSWETVQRLAIVVGFPPPNVLLGRFGVMSRHDPDDDRWEVRAPTADSRRSRR